MSEEWRVVLRDRTATARVIAGDRVFEDVPIVTARRDESDEEVLASLGHDAVLLKEAADAAAVRVDGAPTARADVPIFKERVLDPASGASEMVRVRVHAIRERLPESGNGAKKGFFSRLFGN